MGDYKNINLNKIFYDELIDNKILILSIGSLFCGYWFQDIMFSKKFSKIVADIPNFAKDLDFSKILSVFFPYIIAYFLFYIDDIITAYTFPKMEVNVINKLIDQILESIKTTKKSINNSELILNLKSILDIKNIYNLVIVYIMPTLIIGVSLLYYFFSINFSSGMLVVIIISLFVLLNIWLESGCVEVSQEHDQEIGVLYDNIQDVIVNYETVITSDTIKKELNMIKKSGDKCQKKHKKSEIVNSEITLGLSTLSMFFMLLIDGVAIDLYYKNKIGSEVLITICMLCYSFTQYYNSSVFKFKSVMHHISRYKELSKYFSEFSIEKEKDGGNVNVSNGEIVFKNVKPINDKKVLDKKINLKIKGKSKTGIVGEIGTGKTSILKILAGLKKYEGKIHVDGQDFNNFSGKDITDNIIFIQQHPKLFNRTIIENLSYGGNHTDEEIIKLIENLGLNKFFKKFEKNVYTVVGKEGSKLSGGQKQIVALIRAIIHQKKIILLDEPTSSLDSETKKIFIDLINSIKDKTIVVVTHDKTIYDLFDDMIEI